MIRLAIAITLLLVAIVVIRRKQRTGPNGEVLRVASRTGISRGVMAAVLEVEQRRFLVTITATSTTLVAELGPTGLPIATSEHAPAAVAGGPLAGAALAGTAVPVTTGGTGAPAASAAPAVPVPVAAAMPAPASADPAAADASAGGSLLDRLRARTVRAYDPELVAQLRAER